MRCPPREKGTPHVSRYILRRLGQAVFVLVVAYVVSYLVLWALPGDALASITGGQSSDLSAGQLAAIRTEWGLDQPVLVRLGTAALHAASNDVVEMMGQARLRSLVLGRLRPDLDDLDRVAAALGDACRRQGARHVREAAGLLLGLALLPLLRHALLAVGLL